VFLSTVCTGIEFLCVILLPVSVRRPPLLLIGYIVLPVCIPRLSSCSFPLCFLQPIVSSVQPYVDYVLDTLVLILYCLPSHRVLSTLFIFLTLLIKSDRHRQMRRAPLFFLSHNRDSSYIIVPLHPPFFSVSHQLVPLLSLFVFLCRRLFFIVLSLAPFRVATVWIYFLVG
jgi:hypothetical protein